MNKIRQTISLTLVLMLLSVSVSAQRQRRPYRITDRQIENLIRRVELSSERFQSTLDAALDRSRYDGTRSEDDINSFVRNYTTATQQLRQRFNRRVCANCAFESAGCPAKRSRVRAIQLMASSGRFASRRESIVFRKAFSARSPSGNRVAYSA